jgi:hypothetical protein
LSGIAAHAPLAGTTAPESPAACGDRAGSAVPPAATPAGNLPDFSLFFRRGGLFIEDFQDFRDALRIFSLRFSLTEGE